MMIKRLTLIVFLTIFLSQNSFSSQKTYCIQLASLKDQEAINRVTKVLSDQRKNIKYKKVGKFFVVFLGPWANKDKAKNLFLKLKPKLKTCCSDAFIRTCKKEIVVNQSKIYRESLNKLTKKKGTSKTPNFKKSQQISNDYVLLITKAKVCISKKDCNMAIKYLLKAIEKEPNNPEPYIYLGYAYLHLGNIVKAKDAFSKALLINPSYSEGYAALGYLYSKIGKPDIASIFFGKAYKLKPNNLYYATNYAISLEQIGKFNKSEKLFKKLRRTFPFIPEVYFNEGLLYLKENKLQNALKDFRIFISLTDGIKRYRYYNEKAKFIIEQIKGIIRDGKTR